MKQLLSFLAVGALILGLEATAADKDDKPNIEGLLKQLQDKDEFVRIKAAKLLGRLGPKAKSAVPALTEALKDTDVDVRAVVRNALEAIQGAAAAGKTGDAKLDALIKELKGKNYNARLKAVAKAAELGEEAKPVAPFIAEMMMERFPANREVFLEAIEKTDPEGHKPIFALLTETEADKKLEAIDSMEELGAKGKTCVPVLLRILFLDRGGQVTKDFVFAQKIVPVLVKIAPDDKGVIQAVLGACAPQRRPLPDSPIRLKAIEVVRELKTDNKAIVKALVTALIDPLARLAAIEVLGSMGKDAKDSLPVLMKLQTDASPEIREAASQAISQIKE